MKFKLKALWAMIISTPGSYRMLRHFGHSRIQAVYCMVRYPGMRWMPKYTRQYFRSET